jgi:hypothetical protein
MNSDWELYLSRREKENEGGIAIFFYQLEINKID